ncbi:MAG: monovalent cation/H(+) antiporter subunit G [Pseudomonas sp.]|jgi:multicomponent Na+:H+ antiporter subunit G|nr:monovalent cation/H(+) antiporter subunit G [Pseudomonas sp.]
MSVVVDAWSVLAVLAGGFFFFVGSLGLLRFPDAFTRLHALTKADNLGLGLVVLGLLPQMGSWFAGLKVLSIWLLVLLSASIVSQLIARAIKRREG